MDQQYCYHHGDTVMTHLFDFICIVDEEQIRSPNQTGEADDLSEPPVQLHSHVGHIGDLVLAHDRKETARNGERQRMLNASECCKR